MHSKQPLTAAVPSDKKESAERKIVRVARAKRPIAKAQRTDAIKEQIQQVESLKNKILEAAKEGDVSKIQEALADGACIQVKNDSGQTPLFLAAQFAMHYESAHETGSSNALIFLITNQANPYLDSTVYRDHLKGPWLQVLTDLESIRSTQLAVCQYPEDIKRESDKFNQNFCRELHQEILKRRANVEFYKVMSAPDEDDSTNDDAIDESDSKQEIENKTDEVSHSLDSSEPSASISEFDATKLPSLAQPSMQGSIVFDFAEELESNPLQTELVRIETSSGTQQFIITDRAESSSLNNPSSWGETALVIELSSNHVFLAAHLPQDIVRAFSTPSAKPTPICCYNGVEDFEEKNEDFSLSRKKLIAKTFMRAAAGEHDEAFWRSEDLLVRDQYNRSLGDVAEEYGWHDLAGYLRRAEIQKSKEKEGRFDYLTRFASLANTEANLNYTKEDYQKELSALEKERTKKSALAKCFVPYSTSRVPLPFDVEKKEESKRTDEAVKEQKTQSVIEEKKDQTIPCVRPTVTITAAQLMAVQPARLGGSAFTFFPALSGNGMSIRDEIKTSSNGHSPAQEDKTTPQKSQTADLSPDKVAQFEAHFQEVATQQPAKDWVEQYNQYLQKAKLAKQRANDWLKEYKQRAQNKLPTDAASLKSKHLQHLPPEKVAQFEEHFQELAKQNAQGWLEQYKQYLQKAKLAKQHAKDEVGEYKQKTQDTLLTDDASLKNKHLQRIIKTGSHFMTAPSAALTEIVDSSKQDSTSPANLGFFSADRGMHAAFESTPLVHAIQSVGNLGNFSKL